jgi:S1-C subfamily serine protease
MSHRPCVIVLNLLFLCSLIAPTYAQENLPKLIKRIQPAVVTVIGYDAHGKVIRLGSGFFIDSHDHIITNGHVISGVAKAEVKTADGARYLLKAMVSEDREMDLVKLVVEGLKGTHSYLPITPTQPEVGERVVVVGSPLGLEQTVSDGMVSAIRNIPGRGEILQISAPVSAGSSGGPVVNLKGEVIGVATFQMSRGQNLNFAIPGRRVQALRDFPPRLITEKKAEERQNSQPGLKPSLPPRPTLLVPPPKLQFQQP